MKAIRTFCPFVGLALCLYLLAASLTGCDRAMVKEVVTVEVPVLRYVSVDPALTAPLPIEQPKDATCGEATRVAKVRAKAIKDANDRLAAIAKQGETLVCPK